MADDPVVLADGLGFPEGPVAMADGSVILVEVRAGLVRRVWGRGRSEIVARPGGGPNGAAMGPDGALYICNNGGTDWRARVNLDTPDAVGRIERIDLGTGRVERVLDSCEGFPLRAPNDLVFDRTGGLWFTDTGKIFARTMDRAALYHCWPGSGRAECVHLGGITYNGVGLSPDERTLYVAETRTARLLSFALEAPGKIAAGMPDPTWIATGANDARFDSLAVTEAGNVCIGTLGTGGITTVTPVGKTRLTPLDDTIVTNIAFGGSDRRTAYITQAGAGRLVAMAWPEPGLALNFQA